MNIKQNIDSIKEVPCVVPLNMDDRVVLHMHTGCGYSTANGVIFSEKHPFQLVYASEATVLLETNRFCIAEREDVKAFYNL